MRLWIWLHVMDLIAAMPGGFGSRPYLWAVERASDATDWVGEKESDAAK